MGVAGKMDATPFVQAVMQQGHSQGFAEDLAEAVAQGAANKTPSYPATLQVGLGSAGYTVSADLVNGKLTLIDLKRVV